MINRINNILKSIFLSWIVLVGVISNHPECRTVITDICFQEKLSILPANILVLNSMSGCSEGFCCEEQECKDEKNIFISGQYPDKIKQVWASGNKIVFTGNKSKKSFEGSYQNKIPKTNSIYILTQSFLC